MPVEIHGRLYYGVAERLSMFRKDCPAQLGWSITTETRTVGGNVVAKATITNPNGNVIATGTAERTPDEARKLGGRTREFAETGAVGRALAFMGYSGTTVGGEVTEIASAEDLDFLQAESMDIETDYMPGLLKAIKDEDSLAVRELWDEVGDRGKTVLWRLLDSHKKGAIRKLLADSYENNPIEKQLAEGYETGETDEQV